MEMKNDIEVQGNLESVDANLNMVLSASKVLNPEEYPHIVSSYSPQLSIRNMYIRGNLIRFIRMKEQSVDLDLVRTLCLKEIKKEHKNT